MSTYHGERAGQVCEVTVDGQPLRPRSDLSGNASTAFDWGFVGSGQLSVALLSDFLGDDRQAKALCQAFEEKVIAELPRDSWTMTEHDLVKILRHLAGAGVNADGANTVIESVDEAGGSSFGDMPVQTAGLVVQDSRPEGPTSTSQ